MKFSDNNLRELRYLADSRGQARISRIFDLHFGKVVKTALKVRKNNILLIRDVFIYVFVTFEWQRARIAFRGCIWCGSQRNSLKLRFLFAMKSTASQHALGRKQTETGGNAIEHSVYIYMPVKW